MTVNGIYLDFELLDRQNQTSEDVSLSSGNLCHVILAIFFHFHCAIYHLWQSFTSSPVWTVIHGSGSSPTSEIRAPLLFLTVSGWFSKISLASSLLHSSSMHSLSRSPFLLSSNRELALRCLLRNCEAVLWLRTRTHTKTHTHSNTLCCFACNKCKSLCMLSCSMHIITTHDWSQQEFKSPASSWQMADAAGACVDESGQPNYSSVNWPE